MVTKTLITAEELREILDFNPETGIFTWRRNFFKYKIGKVAGSFSHQGYYRICIGPNEDEYRSHRLAWLWMTGRWPNSQIDHINGNKGDNRFCNLREATASQNGSNRKIGKNNTSGYKGVVFVSRLKKNPWYAKIRLDGKHIDLGYHPTPEAAYDAYCKASEKYHREFGRVI